MTHLIWLLLATAPVAGFTAQEPALVLYAQQSLSSDILYGDVSFVLRSGDPGSMTIQEVALSNITLAEGCNSEFRFDYAYAHTPGYADTIAIEISTDQGAHWTNIHQNAGTEMSTTGTNTGHFIPNDAEWRSHMIDMTGYCGNVDIRFRYSGTSGQDFYVNNLRVSKKSTHVSE